MLRSWESSQTLWFMPLAGSVAYGPIDCTSPVQCVMRYYCDRLEELLRL